MYDFDGVALVGVGVEGESDCAEGTHSYIFDETELGNRWEVAIGLYSELHRISIILELYSIFNY